MGIGVVAKNHLQPPKTMFLPQMILKIKSKSSILFIRFNIYYVIRMSFACHFYALLFYLYVLVCHLYVTRMYWFIIRM